MIVDHLEDRGEITSRKMFGGAGIYHKGKIIGVGNLELNNGLQKIEKSMEDPYRTILKKGTTPLFVYIDGEIIGLLSVKDHVKSNARKTIKNLKDLGIINLSILSGDHKRAVRTVASDLTIDRYQSDLKPQEKLDKMQEMHGSGKRIMFVGDGINDAPALAMSDVGMAMGAKGTDVALETADVVLMEDDVSKVPFLIRLSRHTLRIIKFNIAFGIIFNALAIFASGSGLLTPILGAVVHNIGSVFVVLMSASIVLGKYR
jgi:Cd2+/Zn2+-exporting ATPase